MSLITRWEQTNQAHLDAQFRWIRLRLRELIPERLSEPKPAVSESGRGWFRRSKPDVAKKHEAPERLQLAAPEKDELTKISEEIEQLEMQSPPPALKLLSERMGLSAFEQQVLALCVAQELDTRLQYLCALAQDDNQLRHPSFALAFRMFEDPDWGAQSPHSPLRFWRLIEIDQHDGLPLISAPLRADERIVNYVKGLNYLDDRLARRVSALPKRLPIESLPPSQQRVSDEILAFIQAEPARHQARPIRLAGHDHESKRLVAAEACKSLDLSLYLLHSSQLANGDRDIETFARLWQRESRLLPLALFIDAGEATEAESRGLSQFSERIFESGYGVLFIDEAPGSSAFPGARTFEVGKPGPEEQVQLWRESLGSAADDELEQLAEQFSFNGTEISRIADRVLENEQDPETGVWEACRLATRSNLSRLARRIDARATWADIVLPEEQTALLKQISQQVFSRKRVYSDWGFREKMNRGLGINALFCGESGTGKTMAAEVIANACRLDLYCIDLSAVISKYIGETEKNLRQLFDAAEDSGAILFFDEADALFGKRSEVKDSHDRYANTQIDYLLQRMEAFPGLAILATNMKSAMDKAFTRRLRFIVNFPFPEQQLRLEIWKRVFPEQTPLSEGIDYPRLARLNLTGGSIHNIALNAAFLAAEQGAEVGMPQILQSARNEFRKIGRPVKESDFLWQEPLEAVK